jgi:hypothetical protein
MKKPMIMIAVLDVLLFAGCGQIEYTSAPDSNNEELAVIVAETEVTGLQVTKTTSDEKPTETEEVTDLNTTTTNISEQTSSTNEIENTEIAATEQDVTSVLVQTESEPESTTIDIRTADTKLNETTVNAVSVQTESITNETKPTKPSESWKVIKVDYSEGINYSNEIILSDEDTRIIKEYCFSCKYEIGTGDCINNYIFVMENGEQMCYSSHCGTFNDNINNRSYETLDWMREEINQILSKY